MSLSENKCGEFLTVSTVSSLASLIHTALATWCPPTLLHGARPRNTVAGNHYGRWEPVTGALAGYGPGMVAKRATRVEGGRALAIPLYAPPWRAREPRPLA